MNRLVKSFWKIFQPTVLLPSKELVSAPRPNRGSWVLSPTNPPENLITEVWGIVRFHNQWILIHHQQEGFKIPGGEKQLDETALDCFLREIHQECGIKSISEVELIAHQRVHVYAQRPHKYLKPYPVSYVVVYRAEVTELDFFRSNLNVLERKIIRDDELVKLPIYRQFKFLFDAY